MQNISFPLGIAEEPYFCNREIETRALIRNIRNHTHTVLISPRRYGKTSLAYRAIKKSKLPNACADLYMTTNALDIERAIIGCVDSLLAQVSNNAEILLGLVKDYIKSLKPSFEMGSKGLKIKLESTARSTSAANICEALQILDGVLNKKSMQGVLLLDEFQETHRVAPDHGIEGAIRHVAQQSKNFTIIFSGSHRYLLKSMFNDRSKPLYRLCDEIPLARISEKDYSPFLQKFAVQKWGKPLPRLVVNKIFNFSGRHPYYFNAICEKLFAKKTLPLELDVDHIWNNLIVLKKKDILGETKDLNITHKKLLVAIAHGIDQQLTGHSFLAQTELAGASVVRALEYLENNDFIEKNNDCYAIIDPLLKAIINKLTYF